MSQAPLEAIVIAITHEVFKKLKIQNLSFQVIVDPVDFHNFIKSFRNIQSKKEDNQIELRNLVLAWKSRLRNDQNTQEIRTQAYELIDTIESLHDEQDMLLESENKKVELMVRECTTDNGTSNGIPGDFDRVIIDREHEHNDDDDDNRIIRDVGEDFTPMHQEISRRQQYLQMFNNQSTIALKRALLDIEACRKMVDYSKDFVDNDSEVSSSGDSSEDGSFPHPV